MLPEKFIETIARELGSEECTALCAALDGEPPVSVRLNPRKPAPTLSGVAVAWCPEGLYLAERPPFTFDSDFHAGAYYVQEASSQFVGHLLGNVEMYGKRILDLCAAPGGKTTLYSSLVGEQGLVVANEVDRRRAQILADNVRKWGVGNVVVTTNEAAQVAQFEAGFDAVAVDAPCSGEGMFRKDMQAREEWSENNVRICAVRQAEILCEAWRALKPGGILIYSTCTFNRAEDEGSVENLLEQVGDEAVEIDVPPVEPSWGIVCGSVGVVRTFRFFPHKACGEGFFAAVVRKAHDVGGRMRIPKATRSPLATVDKAAVKELGRWVCDPRQMRFAAVGDMLYGYYTAQAEAVREVAGVLNVIYSGVAMGQLFNGRLRPDGALALFCGLNREVVPTVELKGTELLRYLRRQDVDPHTFTEGINLIVARGQTLGFAKRIGGRVNNMYPNSLRIIKQE